MTVGELPPPRTIADNMRSAYGDALDLGVLVPDPFYDVTMFVNQHDRRIPFVRLACSSDGQTVCAELANCLSMKSVPTSEDSDDDQWFYEHSRRESPGPWRLSPDGTRIAMRWPPHTVLERTALDHDRFGKLALMRRRRKLSDTAHVYGWVDNDTVLIGDGTTLAIVPFLGGEVIWSTTCAGEVTDAELSPDGALIAVVVDRHELFTVDRRSGEHFSVRQIDPTNHGGGSMVIWAPNSELALIRGWRDAAVICVRAASKILPRTSVDTTVYQAAWAPDSRSVALATGEDHLIIRSAGGALLHRVGYKREDEDSELARYIDVAWTSQNMLIASDADAGTLDSWYVVTQRLFLDNGASVAVEAKVDFAWNTGKGKFCYLLREITLDGHRLAPPKGRDGRLVGDTVLWLGPTPSFREARLVGGDRIRFQATIATERDGRFRFRLIREAQILSHNQAHQLSIPM